MAAEQSERVTRVLVVDDEPDVCELVAEELANCQVDNAHSFDVAKGKLNSETYDVVILDIMGVDGHQLLELFGQKVPCIMLTAHALNSDTFQKSVEGKARLFLPKDEIHRLGEYVDKVLSTPKPLWRWLLKRFDFERMFGPEFMARSFIQRMRDDEIF